MIQMLRQGACSGQLADMAHVTTNDCYADCLTKHSAKPDSLVQAVETGDLKNADCHPPFRSLLQHKAYLIQWVQLNIINNQRIQ